MTDHDFHFDADAHLYTINGAEVPSVTQALVEAGLVDTRWFTAYAAHRGSMVHKAIALRGLGTLDYEALDPKIKGYVDAYDRFLAEMQFRPFFIEQRVYSTREGFAGTYDQKGLTKDDLIAIVDFKTGALLPATGIQLTGYAIADKETTGARAYADRLVGVQLGVDGSYRMKQYTADFATWRAALQVTRWKRKNKV